MTDVEEENGGFSDLRNGLAEVENSGGKKATHRKNCCSGQKRVRTKDS